MTEDLRSRFIGSIWNYPTIKELEKVVNWSGISEDLIKNPLLTLIQDIHALRMKGDVEYSLSIRDTVQFIEYFKELESDSKSLESTINETILVKYSEPSERELVKIRANDTFGINL